MTKNFLSEKKFCTLRNNKYLQCLGKVCHMIFVNASFSPLNVLIELRYKLKSIVIDSE